MMKAHFTMKLIAWTALLMFVAGTLSANANVAQQGENTRREAERLWELAIAAKGGRERLHAVENMLLSIRIRARRSLVRSVELRFEQFFVFPNKLWFWADQRGTAFGLEIQTVDRERGFGYRVIERNPTAPQIMPGYTPNEERYFFEAQALYLMESRWLRPRPIAVRTERIGFRQFDVVQTIIEREEYDSIQRERYDFYLDRRTHLPVRVVRRTAFESEQEIEATYNIEGYTDVNGIQMPQTVTNIRPITTVRQRVMIRTNLNYNRELFERPPRIEDGPEAWRPRPRTTSTSN
jgi:hypothetical protein